MNFHRRRCFHSRKQETLISAITKKQVFPVHVDDIKILLKFRRYFSTRFFRGMLAATADEFSEYQRSFEVCRA